MARKTSTPDRRSEESSSHDAPYPRPPTQRTLVAVAILSSSGALVSAYLIYVHQRLASEPGWQSFCAISATLNCDTVITSPFGKIGGVPLAAFALWFYLVLGAVAVMGLTGLRRGSSPPSTVALFFVGGVLSTIIAVCLAAISALWVGAWCLLCMILYAVNVSILGMAWRALRQSGESLRAGLIAEGQYWWKHRPQAVWWASILLMTLGGVIFGSTYTSGLSSVCAAVAGVAADAPIEIVVYSDFQCPHCRTLNRELRSLRTQPRLHIVARHYPLDGECNPHARLAKHMGACLQARAAICAASQQSEAAMADLIFEDGARDRERMMELALGLGLKRDPFEACLDSAETEKRLQEDIQAATTAGIRGTPTLFINGQRHAGILSPGDLNCLTSAATAEPASQPSPAKRRGRIGGGTVG